MTEVLILISGLPRSGKSTLAEALSQKEYTHVPLDRYIRRMPPRVTFLEWVASPKCIAWDVLEADLIGLISGEERVAPSDWDWGPAWGPGGQQWVESPRRVRLMKPSVKGYAIPGCYSFQVPQLGLHRLKVFVRTPLVVIAERAMSAAVDRHNVTTVLDQQLSPNWRDIEGYESDADLVVSGVAPHVAQVSAIASALRGT